LFVKYGFLPAEGRKSFSVLDADLLSKIDFERGRNEIPLINNKTGKVLYGIDALLEILDKKIPFIKTVGSFKPVKWFLKKLYKLVSYNRKVIVAKKCGTGIIDCTPDVNYFYRLFFMTISLIFNTIMLFPLHYIVLSKLSYYHLSIVDLQIAHFAFVVINCLLAFSFTKDKAFEYLGQVNMLALSVTLLTTVLMLIQSVIFNQAVVTIYLIAATAFIFKEYTRRMDYAGDLPKNKWVVSINLLCLTGFILFLFH
jgi:hypothetical protein